MQRALRSADHSGLRVLGYGEISLVLGWPTDRPAVAVKRLPRFSSPEAAAVYAETFDRYMGALVERGVDPLRSAFRLVDPSAARPVAYVIQPVLAPETLGPSVLRRGNPDPDHPVLQRIVAAINRVCDPWTGLDAQLSNWAWVAGDLKYLDVTTPMLFDDGGSPQMDLDMFVAAYPWILRRALTRFVAPGVIGAYRDPRRVGVDFAANLHKERLAHWIPTVLEVIGHTSLPPVGVDEVQRYYRSDARLWESMLRLRRADRWWQHHIRRRAYPFLLPGRTER